MGSVGARWLFSPRLVGVVVLLLVLWVPAGFAQDAALSSEERAALTAERDRLFQQMLADPGNMDLLYAYAQVTIALGDYDAAIATYERMLIFNPDLPRIHLELGVLYFRQGAYSVARYHLELALASGDIPPTARTTAEEYLAAIDEVGARHHIEGSLFLGFRYQSNANSGPPAGTRVQIGPLPDLSEIEEGTKEGDVNFTTALNLTHTYDLGTNDYDKWETNLFGYGAVYFEQKDLNLGTVELKTGPRFNNVFTQGLALRPYAIGSWIGLYDTTYYSSMGGGLAMEAALSPRTTLVLDGAYRQRWYGEEYADRDGHQLVGLASLRFLLSPRDLLSIAGAISDNTAEVDYWAYFEGGGNVAYTHLFRETESFLGGALATTLYSGARISSYDGADPLIQPDTVRQDVEWRVGGSAALPVFDSWSVIAAAEYRNVNSNVDLYSFDNVSVTLGALLRF